MRLSDKQILLEFIGQPNHYKYKVSMSSNSPKLPITKSKSSLSKSTTQFFKSESTIDKFISQFFRPKQHDYSENILEFYCNTHNFTQKNYRIPNSEGQLLQATVFYKSKLQQPPKNCIVYCHGFGSTRLQAVHILKVLTQEIALCCFDFSGSGKSEGNITTYGAKEKEDIRSVLTYLKQKLSFINFVLWGRSMGATACLLYSIKYQNGSDHNVIFQIVDSPFASFERISLQLAKKFISMPYFGTNLVLDIIKKHCDSLNEYNPFSVNLENISQCQVPTLIVYSENDEIVSSQNSQELCSKFTAFYEKMIISQKHNAPRTTETLSEIIKKIEIQLKKCELGKKNGIVFRSFLSNKSCRKSKKKGIERSLHKQASLSTIDKFSKPPSVNQITEYGTLNEGKCQTPTPYSTGNFFNNENKIHGIQLLKNKPISFSALPHHFDENEYCSPFLNLEVQTPKTQQVKNFFRSPNGKAQTSQNFYQMRKPKVLKNIKIQQLKKSNDPKNTIETYKPLTDFSRQQVFCQNLNQNDAYRQGLRKSCSTLKKLNISLSKLKNIKDRNFILGNKKRLPNEEQGLSYFFTERQRPIQSSPHIAISLKSMIRPISQCRNTQPLKSSQKSNTPTTKAASVSSSMDNLHFLGVLKSQNVQKSRNGFEKVSKQVKQENLRGEKEVRKIRSSEMIYLDKSVYKYGL